MSVNNTMSYNTHDKADKIVKSISDLLCLLLFVNSNA